MTQVKSNGGDTPSFPDDPGAATGSRVRHDSAPLRWGLLTVAVTLALYLRTVAPDVLPGDPGEFQFAAWQLGLAHATGYPLYLLLGWAWQHLLALVGIAPAAALNAMSAVAGGAGVGLIYLLMTRWNAGAMGTAVGLYSAMLLAVNPTYWSQALIAEVYTLQVVLMLLLFLAAQRMATQATPSRLLLLALLAGLALTHHAMTVLLLPALAVYLILAQPAWRRLPIWSWPLALFAGALPLLLYFYIPLRSGPDASPWYHQPLGDGVLVLYSGGWDAFIAFISGRSISVGFRDLGSALGQVGEAAWLWRYHFGWVGLVLMILGIAWLARTGQRPILVATVAYALLQQTFNLFYNIGDIFVYYIPLYVIGAIWAGFGLAGLTTGRWRDDAPPQTANAASGRFAILGRLVAGALILLALRDVTTTTALLDQSGSRSARLQWEAILETSPPPGSILITNDRDEMVPLFYFQNVENRGQGLTGLFPLIAPDARFTDIGATIATALTANRGSHVYLIKPMPGLEVRFGLEEGPLPLVRVTGNAATAAPTLPVDAPFGPLRLLGVDFARAGADVTVDVHWRVEQPIDGDYTATVQWLDADDDKLGQHDHLAGGVYYPTSLWKPGEVLVVRHHMTVTPAPGADTRLLIGMYRGAAFTPLAPSLTIPLPTSPE